MPSPDPPSPLAHALEAPLRQFLAQTGPDHSSNLHALVIADVERVLLRVVMEARGDNQLQAAATLGLNRNTLRKKLTALGLTHPRQRSRLGQRKLGKPKMLDAKPTRRTTP